ncbi:MAG: TonB-dependent receptor [Bryobacterales bacterium]|nr:TonB-dependent receptor [Bryobacterales bacterium]MEB2361544.1 TonB-dependent receptor [Bryobacterales bacterium]
MTLQLVMKVAAALHLSVMIVSSQEPSGGISGSVTDPSGATVPRTRVIVKHKQTGQSQVRTTPESGFFTFPALPAGDYELLAEADGFALLRVPQVKVEIDRTIRLSLELAITGSERVEVSGVAETVDHDSNTLGQTVTERQITDLPLNGRNFTQLGLLQAGVVPLTNGLVSAGGSIKATQAFAVNGQRPESNNYLLDGVRNVNRMDGGFAIRTPIDALQEFRTLTHTAPPEYGSASGAAVSVVTRSGGNSMHGGLYYFGRNDVVDARNFFSADVEPLKQHQFGATLGGPLRRNGLFFFGYYEGFRNRQGVTKTTTVPSPAERAGDFSALQDPSTNNLLINFLTGQPFPGNRIPREMLNPVSQRVLEFYPLGNVSPSLFRATEVQRNDVDQGGIRIDAIASERDQFAVRYATSAGSNFNPLSIRGADVPGFPTGDDIRIHSATVSHTHVSGPDALNTLRAAFFRNRFLFDQRFNHTTPRSLGFQYDNTFAPALGPPYFIVNGYASVGNPITGPRNSVQNDYEIYEAFLLVRGAHTVKIGGGFRRTHINISQGIAANGFFVFAPFPTNSSFANFLIGFPVVFFQGGGDFQRGLRSFEASGYAQDQWRVTRNLTLNYGLRYEINSPFAEIRDRLNQFAPGRQSQVFPDAPRGVLFPGDPGVAKRILNIYYKGLMPRVGLAYDPTGSGRTSLRVAYGIFYDAFSNGSSMPMQAAISALPWLQAVQLGPPALNYTDPWGARGVPFRPGFFPNPVTMLTENPAGRPPYAQNWNFSIQQSLPSAVLFEIRYVGTKGTRVPRFIEANPSVYTPGASSQSVDARRIHAGCPAAAGPCDFASVGLVDYSTNSTYHALQTTLLRRFHRGLTFNTSYWFSKTLDYVSSMNVAGSAPRLVSGENDIAQNPFDLRAERGPSLFDAKHRWTASATWELPFGKTLRGVSRALGADWQLNAIATVSSGTPFTVYDTRNVAQQGSHPEITGFAGSRPDLVADPNDGPRTVAQWISRSAFRRLDAVAEAGRFGNAGRNIARGPGQGTLDVSAFKNWSLSEQLRVQLRIEAFNVTNHANFGVPVNDLVSPNFGRILEAGPPRVFQAGLKMLF